MGSGIDIRQQGFNCRRELGIVSRHGVAQGLLNGQIDWTGIQFDVFAISAASESESVFCFEYYCLSIGRPAVEGASRIVKCEALQ